MKKYDSSSIDTLRFPDAIRKNCAMYLGSTDEHGRWLIARELLDNGFDEFLAGRNKSVALIECKDGTYWVLDSGSGIPQGFKTFEVNLNGKIVKNKIPTMQAIFSELHTSGKFRSEAYKTSVGCFTGDTKIRLLNGKIITFKQLYERWKTNQSPIEIMTWNTTKDKVEYSRISHVQLSKYTKDLVEVNIDGNLVRCTPDHPFFTRTDDGIKKVKAKDLQIGDSLVSMNLKSDRDGYLYSLDLKRNNPKSSNRLHRSVCEYFGEAIKGKIVHHKNRNKTDNSSTNLIALSSKEHNIEHHGDKSYYSYYNIMVNHEARQEKSKLFSEINKDEDINYDWVKAKAIHGGMRCLIFGKPVTKENYSIYRMHGSLGADNIIGYFSSWKSFANECRHLYAYHKKHALTHKSSEDYLNKLKNHTNNQDTICKDASIQALFAQWKRRIQSIGMDISKITPRVFNGEVKNIGYGHYAMLKGWTTLNEVKSAILENRNPTLFEDLSEREREKRSALAEAKMRNSDSRARVIHKFVLACRRLNAYDEHSYMMTKTATDPKWIFACACCYISHGVKASQINRFIESYNHQVCGIRKITLRKEVPVYGMTVDNCHTYFIEPGILVSNTHGVGAKGTNATSDLFEVYTKFEGSWYSIKFEKGILKSPVKKIKTPKGPTGKLLTSGTAIHFKPDASIFSGKSDIDLKFAHSWAEITSYLNPTFTVLIMDKKGKKTKYYSKDGAKAYVSKILEELKAQAEPTRFAFSNELADVVVAFSNAEGLNIRGYTNGLFNSQGGKHVDSVCTSLLSALKPYAKKKQTISAYDVKEGLVGIVNMKLHKAEFSSQDKARLTDIRAGDGFVALLTKQFEKFFKSNKALAMRLCEKASKLSELRSQFKASKKVVQALNQIKKKGMPEKYAGFDSRSKFDDRELLIVEGESAGGNLRKKRKPYQALLPLRGKIQNAEKSGDKVLESEEVLNILGAIGFDPKAKNPMDKLQINKIICLADPDPDGCHINSLLLCLFRKYIPKLFDEGRIFVADVPELYAMYKSHLVLGETISEVKAKLEKLKAPKNTAIHHIKGWGEIDASLMEVLAVNSETRRLLKVVPSGADTIKFVKCMNDDVQFRKNMLNLPDKA